jgi:hypothetical protein
VNRRRLWYAVDFLIVFLFVALLIRPLFRVKYMELWGSIESTFISDARFLRDNWPHPNWQPNWYCGTRTDYIYPPALRYGTAVITKVHPKVLPVRAYHLYIAFFYCFGIGAVYLLARYGGGGSRMAGYIAAAATALLGPSAAFVQRLRVDNPWLMPNRLNVLVRYGEGPHITAVAWMGLALLFSFRALQQWRPVSLALASISCAFVVGNNFYGATALAIFFGVLVLAVYITHRDLWVFVRAAAIAALSYGLSAFWLVPSYLEITVANMRFVSTQGNQWSIWVALAVVIAFVLLADHFARGRREAAYIVFLAGSVALFVLNVLGHEYLNFRVYGEPGRLYPELDLVLILLGVELLRRFWQTGPRWRKAVAAVVVVACLGTSYHYLQVARTFFVADPDHTDQVEFQMQDWMAKNMPQARALTAGAVRFWYNAWNDLPQVGGGSEQGLLNPMVMPAQWEILLGDNLDLTVWWLQLMGADVVLVNEPHSREHYRDFQHPEKFRGKLDVIHDNGAGDIIYRVPRRYPGLARVVERSQFDVLPDIPGNGDKPSLSAWAEVIERGPEAPTLTKWIGTDELHVRAPVKDGQAVFVQVSYDSNWRAYVDGQRVPIRRNKLGLMTVDAPPGTEDIRLHFPTPFSNQVGRALTLLSFLVVGGLFYWSRR